jgi:flagellar hook-basal body complex protein FliE
MVIEPTSLSALMPSVDNSNRVNAGTFVNPLRQNQTKSTSFSEIFSNGIEEVNKQLLTSQVDLQSMAAGKTENLHQIMIRLEESRLSFQLMMQVRNRLLEAYQDVMKMQI